jgi:hypothetical protein
VHRAFFRPQTGIRALRVFAADLFRAWRFFFAPTKTNSTVAHRAASA